MSASNTGPGGVRNLRAMFENKASDELNSPPSRGRSPNGSVSSAQDASLSKVRASFVAVDKPGEEAQSQANLRKASNATMDSTNEQAIADEQGLGEILKGSPFLDEGRFTTGGVQEPESKGVADRAAAMVKKMQQGNTEPRPIGSVDADAPPKPHPHGHGQTVHHPKAPVATTASPMDSNKSPTEMKGPIVKPRGGVAKIKGVMESAAKAQDEREAIAREAKEKDAASKARDTNTSTDKPKNGTPSSGQGVKPRGGVSKIQGVMESAARARNERDAIANKAEDKKDVSEARDTNIPTDKPKNGTVSLVHGVRPRGGPAKIQGVMESVNRAKEARATAAAQSLPQGDGSNDTKPAAGTKQSRSSLPPKKLPVTNSALPASSAAKTDESKAAEKKAVKAPTRVANVTNASTLAKKSSRASLNNSDGLKARSTTRTADEGFLARMMRPTASSAQKTHDKVQVQSPPRSKQTSERTLTSKPSRRSLGQPNDNKENEADIPSVPVIPPEKREQVEPSES